MVFDGLDEIRPGIEETCDSGVVFCEDLYDCWWNKDSWGRLMTEPFNRGGTGINVDDNSLLFDLLSFQLKHRLSRGEFFEDMGDYWQNENSWGVLITESFNGGFIVITGDYNLLIFEWVSLQLKHRLSQVVVPCLPWLSPVPILWRLPIPFGRGTMNAI